MARHRKPLYERNDVIILGAALLIAIVLLSVAMILKSDRTDRTESTTTTSTSSTPSTPITTELATPDKMKEALDDYERRNRGQESTDSPTSGSGNSRWTVSTETSGELATP